MSELADAINGLSYLGDERPDSYVICTKDDMISIKVVVELAREPKLRKLNRFKRSFSESLGVKDCGVVFEVAASKEFEHSAIVLIAPEMMVLSALKLFLAYLWQSDLTRYPVFSCTFDDNQS